MEINLTDSDVANGLRSQVAMLIDQLTRVQIENAALRRTIVEKDAAGVTKEKSNAPEKGK